MCTALSFKTKDNYFGRNLDLEYSYNESVTVMPRNYVLNFRNKKQIKNHYAMIGMAYIIDDYPLFYDATNEKGLSMAGLNFPDNAVYNKNKDGVDNIAQFEFIPWILSQCSDVNQARDLLENINLTDESYSEDLPITTLHWMISDKNSSIVIESMKDGLHIYDNPVGVMTNNPPFDYQMFNLNNYMHLSKEPAENKFSNSINLHSYSRGMGAIGMPGDLSSQSRFVKAVFTKLNSVTGNSESESISQFFHILESVYQQKGLVKLDDKYEFTIYSSCCNTDRGIYYYTTYENSQITAVDMHREDLNSQKIISYPIIQTQNIHFTN